MSGGTPPDEDKARELHGRTDPEDIIAAAVAAVQFVLTHAESNGNVGAVGFCFGGGGVNRMAAERLDLKAAVVYYGLQVPADRVHALVRKAGAPPPRVSVRPDNSPGAAA